MLRGSPLPHRLFCAALLFFAPPPLAAAAEDPVSPPAAAPSGGPRAPIWTGPAEDVSRVGHCLLEAMSVSLGPPPGGDPARAHEPMAEAYRLCVSRPAPPPGGGR